MARGRRGLWVLIAVAPWACVEIDEREPPSVVYQDDIEVLTAPCLECHATDGVSPRLESFVDFVACDVERKLRIAQPGNPESPVLTVLERDDHRSLVDDDTRDRIGRWVVLDQVLYASSLPHPPGFAVPGTEGFHGDFLRSSGYAGLLSSDREASCFRCHGQPRELGGSIPCETCHETFAQDRCDSCHGANGNPRPRLDPCSSPREQQAAGAHAIHLDPSATPQFPALPCQTCHEVPEQVSDPGHIDGDNNGADVRFDPSRDPTAVFDRATGTCGESTCHFSKPMMWSQTETTEPSCARCHGDPPEGHVNNQCVRCHGAAFSSDGVIDGSLHVNGVLNVGVECTDCHSVIGAAHEKHLLVGAFSDGVPCSSCHIVPMDRDDPGHIDTDLPPEINFSGLALGDGLMPAFNEDGRCSQVACHGGNLDGAAETTPPWTGADAVMCGDCHGLPPTSVRQGAGVHLPTGPAACGSCHITPDNEPITVGTSSITPAGRRVHVNGCVDLAKDLGGGCEG